MIAASQEHGIALADGGLGATPPTRRVGVVGHIASGDDGVRAFGERELEHAAPIRPIGCVAYESDLQVRLGGHRTDAAGTARAAGSPGGAARSARSARSARGTT